MALHVFVFACARRLISSTSPEAARHAAPSGLGNAFFSSADFAAFAILGRFLRI